MNPEHSAGIIVFYPDGKEAKYLLLHYHAGHWSFPKGQIEKGEAEEQTAMRELAEETGLDHVFMINGFNQRINFYYTREGGTYFKEVSYFLAQSPSKDVTISDEHIGFRWLPLDMAKRALTFKNEQELLQKADDWLKTKKPAHGGRFSGHASEGTRI